MVRNGFVANFKSRPYLFVYFSQLLFTKTERSVATFPQDTVVLASTVVTQEDVVMQVVSTITVS